MQFDVRITVQKKLFHNDLIDQFAEAPEKWTPCKKFNVGETFIVPGDTPWDKPEGFCGWAWADIQKMVWGMARGGPQRFVTCCTDGYRPVVFSLEQVPSL